MTLPLVAPTLGAGAALAWARALGEFGATITFAGNLPGSTQTMPLAVYLALQNNLGAAMALSLVMLAISVTVLVVLRGRGSRRDEHQRDTRDRRLRRGVSLSLRADIALKMGTLAIDVGFTIEDGRVLGLVGPNAAGKTTLLRALAGLAPLACGRVVLDGEVLDDTAVGVRVLTERRPIGVVFQDYRLFPHSQPSTTSPLGCDLVGYRAPRPSEGRRTG